MQTNPYRDPYAVLLPEKLYGRTRVLRTLVGNLFNGARPLSQQLVGPTRIGKTSILNAVSQLNGKRTEDRRFAEFLSVSLKAVESLAIVYVDFTNMDLSAPNVSEQMALWTAMDKHLRRAMKKQHDITWENEDDPVTLDGFRNSIDIARNLLSSPDSRIVFLLDEFDRVAEYFPMEVSWNLRGLLSERDFASSVAYITASRRTLGEIYLSRPNPTGTDFSPLFNYFDIPLYPEVLEYKEVAYNKEKKFWHGWEGDVVDFITQPSATHGVVFSDEEVEIALELGGQHPDLTRITCRHIFDQRCLGVDRIIKTRLQNIVAREFRPTFQVIWNQITEDEKTVLTSLAGLWSGGMGSVREIVPELLVNRGLVRIAGGGHTLISDVFRILIRDLASLPVSEYVRIWPDQKMAQVNNKIEPLTGNEWKIFMYLYEHAGRVCTRAELLKALGDSQDAATDANLENTIFRLRQKLEPNPNTPRIIVTKRAQGYFLDIRKVGEDNHEKH